jgi:hypothetical protein
LTMNWSPALLSFLRSREAWESSVRVIPIGLRFRKPHRLRTLRLVALVADRVVRQLGSSTRSATLDRLAVVYSVLEVAHG